VRALELDHILVGVLDHLLAHENVTEAKADLYRNGERKGQ
jgi:hypothetical protein